MASRLQDVLLVGARADQPLATDVATGTLYAVNDEDFLIEQSDGAAWSQYGPTGGGISSINVSAGTTSNNMSALTFSNSNGVAFGLNGSVITASFSTAAGAAASIVFSASTQSSSLSAVTFSNANGITFGLDAGTITASHNGITSQSNPGFSAAGGSSTFQTLGFSDNVFGSFTNTNGSVALAGINATFFAASNTTLATSGTQNVSAVTFAGAGGVSVGVSNGSVVVSGATGGGTGGGGGGTISNWNNYCVLTTFANNNNTSLASIQPLNIYNNLAFSNIQFIHQITVTTTNNTSSAFIDISISGVFYTRSGSTLSSFLSFSNVLTNTWRSNSSETVAGLVMLSASLASPTTFTAGSYWLCLHLLTGNSATGGANTTALQIGLQPLLVRQADTNIYSGPHLWGTGGATLTVGLFPGQGIISGGGVTKATIAFSDYTQTGTRAYQAYAVELRNETYQ